MEQLNPETRTSVYYGITFVLARGWIAEKSKTVEFQKSLIDNGLDFSQTNIRGNSFVLTRSGPANLTLKLESAAQQVSSIQIASQNSQGDLEMFIHEAEGVVRAYQQSWPAQQYQIIRSVAKIQHLYSSHDHAFKYLWEQRLGQSPKDFESLGKRPVAGGGIRLILPPYADQGKDPNSIEIRIESFMQEPRKILVETTSVWPKPVVIKGGDNFNCAEILRTVQEYATDQVWTFLTQEKL